MDASILQNPADPDATYREKAGKQNRGYAANLTEACGEEGSIVTDYQYDTNTHSDAAFINLHARTLGTTINETVSAAKD